MDEWEWAAAATEAYSEGYLDGCGDLAVVSVGFANQVDPMRRDNHRVLVVEGELSDGDT